MADTKIYLPRQEVRRGVAGYRGKDVVIVDRNARQTAAEDDAKASAKVIGTKAAKGDGDK